MYSEFLISHLDSQKLLNDDKLKEMFEIFDYNHRGRITIGNIKRVLGGCNTRQMSSH